VNTKEKLFYMLLVPATAGFLFGLATAGTIVAFCCASMTCGGAG